MSNPDLPTVEQLEDLKILIADMDEWIECDPGRRLTARIEIMVARIDVWIAIRKERT